MNGTHGINERRVAPIVSCVPVGWGSIVGKLQRPQVLEMRGDSILAGMATLNEQINTGWKDAMRAGQATRKETLSMLRASVKRAEIDARGSGKAFSPESDDDVRTIIEREAKKRRDAIEEYERADRPDRAEAERAELAILSEYLPQPLSDEELEAAVRAAIEESGAARAADLGKVMRVLMPRVQGRADGKRVNEAARRLLG